MLELAKPVEKHYTIRELQELLGISRSTIDKSCQAGKLKKTKVGNRVLFPASEINRFLQECANDAKF